MVAVWLVVMVAVVALKLAVVLLAETDTEEGIEKTPGMAPDRVTEAPLDEAGLERVTVQPVVALEASEAEEHCNEETNTGAVRRILNVEEEPLREAVIVAV